MFPDEEEKLTDIMLGDAVLYLLQEGSAINVSALIATLQKMAEREESAIYQQACLNALKNVRNSAKLCVCQPDEESNVLPLFSHFPTANATKH
ncbi:hypothetical protein SD961_03490 [Erwinia sp. MMLR14_017]|uniref:hypothetical protein n=1 Tax=Erwinia sp. MMLR14_017 TaxID=3093842 RepID=UPI00298F48AB|nr:hypothetical protein [Erwinia sp. MMLR14_017]MDW8844965.1 hypothetical protein [Erwinia sp. MMLR14_017]